MRIWKQVILKSFHTYARKVLNVQIVMFLIKQIKKSYKYFHTVTLSKQSTTLDNKTTFKPPQVTLLNLFQSDKQTHTVVKTEAATQTY